MDHKVLVSVDSLSFMYEDQQTKALDNVSFQIKEGEWVAIVGHNGSGKSTLAKLLNGLYFTKEGSIRIGDIVISEETVWDARKRVGMVFQNPDNQFVGTTVKDDVAFGLENNAIPREEMHKRVEAALEKVNMLSFLDQEPHHLSGGQKQRVAIAGVIALKPSIIVLDEATSMLDPQGRQEVLELIKELKQENMTVISITHDLDEAARADRIIIMNKGKVYQEGKPSEIFQLEKELIEIGLDIPFAIRLRSGLEAQGIQVDKITLTEEELVTELWTSHFKK
ncbi:energy-coupling factor ABC transporter ATP-binding protein [Niallia taxi]|uniref:Energy-coupling factor ABC transporter ATP-binding protein n=1 Tax=Niallia taxi TaxID=2499688 RepID=A0A437K3S3_9BACI|nr:energy-coupling factor ABC transporter ATP-binding protein [Niallia taxi]MCM3217962.1 energy-coupling factor ABC transporter ATP-binding protein [Niallia taxi]MDK8643104.1 energy-coupling factor ABC transporter ATP-binding protein [Niallia taxi]MED4039311.1 energy-coupling factor ABC transporter ATP-binding protein [Niallia taxi]MED4057111.1 energy-coupling factor ABC transporter ATP-binding protein [Niallia taxi]MED4121508.1 energy-coupling factor ABC transporter ATP-binding protein [Niall